MDRRHFIRLGLAVGAACTLGAGCSNVPKLMAEDSGKPSEFSEEITRDLVHLKGALALNKRWHDHHMNRFIDALSSEQAKALFADGCAFGVPASYAVDFKDVNSLRQGIRLRAKESCGFFHPSTFDFALKYHDELLIPTAQMAGVPGDLGDCSSYELEQRILKKALADKWDRLPKPIRNEFLKKTGWELTAADKASLVAATGTAFALFISTAASIGGFAFYSGVSVALHAVAASVGAVVPMTVYMAVSSTIAAVVSLSLVLIAVLAALSVFVLWRGGRSEDEASPGEKARMALIMQFHAWKVAAQKALGRDVLMVADE